MYMQRQWELADVVEDENALETNAVVEERGLVNI